MVALQVAALCCQAQPHLHVCLCVMESKKEAGEKSFPMYINEVLQWYLGKQIYCVPESWSRPKSNFPLRNNVNERGPPAHGQPVRTGIKKGWGLISSSTPLALSRVQVEGAHSLVAIVRVQTHWVEFDLGGWGGVSKPCTPLTLCVSAH